MIATVLAGISLFATALEGVYWNGIMLCIAITSGSACLAGYFFTSKESLFRYANISLLIAYLIRLIDVVVYCLFAEEAPAYMIFIAGLPSGIAILSEMLILKNGLRDYVATEIKSKGKGILQFVLILQFVILAYSSFLSISALEQGISSSSLSSMYYIALFIINYSLWRILI